MHRSHKYKFESLPRTLVERLQKIDCEKKTKKKIMAKFGEVEIQGYELWELGSEDDLSNYEFDTLRDYDSDNSDSLNFSIQTIETFDTFEESIRENSNQQETQDAQIFQKNSFGVEKQFESQVHEDHKYGNTGCRVFKRWVPN